MDRTLERSAMRKVYLRLLPFAIFVLMCWPISIGSM